MISDIRSCDSCIHNHVCRYKNDKKELVDTINTAVESAVPDIFVVSVTCKHYAPAITTR